MIFLKNMYFIEPKRFLNVISKRNLKLVIWAQIKKFKKTGAKINERHFVLCVFGEISLALASCRSTTLS